MLNLTCYDKHFNKQFVIQLIKLETKQIIFEVDVGHFDKKGRLLTLEETHGLICTRKHKITHAHDPRTDVILTKCISDFVVRKFKYENLIKHF